MRNNKGYKGKGKWQTVEQVLPKEVVLENLRLGKIPEEYNRLWVEKEKQTTNKGSNENKSKKNSKNDQREGQKLTNKGRGNRGRKKLKQWH